MTSKTTLISVAGPGIQPFIGSGKVIYDVDFLAGYSFVNSTPPEGTGLFDSDLVKGWLIVTYLTGDSPPPLVVELLSFDAGITEAGTAVVTWQTATEVNTLGFYVERQQANGAWVRVTEELLPAMGGTRPQSYRFEDPGVTVPGQLRYRLIEVETTGLVTIVSETTAQKALELAIEAAGEGSRLIARGRPGQAAAVETTADLLRGPWERLGTVSLDAAGEALLPWQAAGEGPVRFYRLVQE